FATGAAAIGVGAGAGVGEAIGAGEVFHDPYIGLGRITKRSPKAASASDGALRSDWSRPGKSRMLSPTHITIWSGGTPGAAVPFSTASQRGPLAPLSGLGRSSSKSKGTP